MMTFFKKLFGQKNPQASEKSTTPLNKSHTVSGNPKARCEVLKSTSDIAVLLNSYQTDDNDIVVDCADMRLREVLRSESSEAFFDALTTAQLSHKTQKTLAATAHSARLRQALLAQLDDDQSLLEVIVQTDDLAIKTAAIARLSEMSELQALLKQFKGKQKKLYRTTKDRLSELRDQAAIIEALSVQSEQLQHQVEHQTVNSTHLHAFEKRLHAAQAYLSTAEKETFETQLIEASEQIACITQAKNERQSILSVLAQLQEQLESAQFKGKQTDFTQLVNQIQQDWVQSTPWQSAEAKSYNIRLEQALSKVNAQATQYFNEQHSTHAQRKLLSQCQNWLDGKVFITETMLADQDARWQALPRIADVAVQDNYQQTFSQLQLQLREKSQRQISQQAENDETIVPLVAALSQQIESGEIQQAVETQQAIRDILRSEVGLSKPIHQSVIGTFKQQENQLSELMRWQHFGTDQVRQELIDEMQLLADNAVIDIELKAEQVQALQKRWKNLQGHAPAALWQTFKRIADEAWEPCAAYFKSQREYSRELLQARLDFLTEAEQHISEINWENPNWAAVSEAQKQFEKLWRSFPKIQERDYRKAKVAYQKVAKIWDENLGVERKRELQRRENLIKSVNALINELDTSAAIEQVKTMQREWAPTVQLKRRDQEQALWQRFQKACDAIFAQHGEKRAEERAEQNSTFDAYQQQLNDLSALLAGELPFAEKKHQFQTQAAQLAEFDAVSERAQHALNHQLDKLHDQLATLEQRESADKRQAQLQVVRELDKLCAELETTICGTERREALQKDWETKKAHLSENVSAMNKRFDEAINLAIEHHDSGTASTDVLEAVVLSEQLETAQNMCLTLELSANLSSPMGTEKARETMQLAYLRAAMNGDKSFTEHTTPEGLYQCQWRWFILPKYALTEAYSGNSLTAWQTRFQQGVTANQH